MAYSRYRRAYRSYRKGGYRRRTTYRRRTSASWAKVARPTKQRPQLTAQYKTAIRRLIKAEMTGGEDYAETHIRLFNPSTGRFKDFTNAAAFDMLAQTNTPWVRAVGGAADGLTNDQMLQYLGIANHAAGVAGPNLEVYGNRFFGSGSVSGLPPISPTNPFVSSVPMTDTRENRTRSNPFVTPMSSAARVRLFDPDLEEL